MSRLFFIRLALGLGCLTALAGCRTGPPATAAHPTNYVLVHGAWDGGWDWRHVDELLTADGNQVYRVTLTGQGERSHLTGTNIDLDTHIADAVNVILWENLHEVILVGHSYGGMVITGVADRVPDRLRHVIYVDAFLPTNGESANTAIRPGAPRPMTNDFVYPIGMKRPLPPFREVPMPARTLSEPIVLTNQVVAQKLPTTYLLLLATNQPPPRAMFYRFSQRAQARGWPVWTLQSDHNVQRSHPRELVRLFEQAASQN